MLVRADTMLIICDYLDFEQYAILLQCNRNIREYIMMYLKYRYPKKRQNIITSPLPKIIDTTVRVFDNGYHMRTLSPLLYIIFTGITSSKISRLVYDSVVYEYSRALEAYVPSLLNGIYI